MSHENNSLVQGVFNQNSYTYVVTVNTHSRADADQVMTERIFFDEDYGFDYTVTWQPAALETISSWTGALDLRCTVHRS